MMPRQFNTVSHALQALEPFAHRLLPGMLRRILSWRGHPESEFHELLLDLQQELRLDCLEQPQLVLELPARDRHRRWFRMAERWIYRQRLRSEKNTTVLEPAIRAESISLEPTAANLQRVLPDATPAVLDSLTRDTQRHANGRCHVSKTAARIGLTSREVRSLWERAAERLGYGAEFLAFWQRRLAEAFTGLAADLLRDTDCLHLLRRPRQLPDPRGRIRRIRRIHGILRVRPLNGKVQRAIAPLLRRAEPGRFSPRSLLAQAAELAPDWAAVHLWQFEACCIDADLDGALRALRRARWLGADYGTTALARARLLEARGRPNAARRGLERAIARTGDERLRGAVTMLSGADNAATGPLRPPAVAPETGQAPGAADQRGHQQPTRTAPVTAALAPEPAVSPPAGGARR